MTHSYVMSLEINYYLIKDSLTIKTMDIRPHNNMTFIFHFKWE